MITIVDQPFAFTPIGQKLMIVATSDNSGEDGFRFKCVISVPGQVIISRPPPNPDASLILNIEPLLELANAVIIDGQVVHKLSVQEPEPGGSGVAGVQVDIYESWLVGGVLIDDPDTLGPVEVDFEVFNASFQVSDGYKPSLARFVLDGVSKNWLTDRRWNTHTPASTLNLPVNTSTVFIPVREADYGVFHMLKPDDVTNIQLTIVQSNGTPIVDDYAVSDPIAAWPMYPANLNSASGLKPSDYPNWRYIRFRAETESAGDVMSVNYILYNVAVYGGLDCKHDNVRIAWENSSGGWDYQNFIRKNELSNNIQRRRYRQILGAYGTTFTMNPSDRGLTEREPEVEQFLEISSGFLSENEFVFLKNLIVSKQVQWLHDDGTVTPVLIETNDYKMPRERNGRLKSLSLKLKYANNLWV